MKSMPTGEVEFDGNGSVLTVIDRIQYDIPLEELRVVMLDFTP